MASILITRSLGPVLSIFLLQLLSLTSGLTLPIDTNTTTRQDKLITTEPITLLTVPSLTVMPPAPFDFAVSHTDFHIIFTNYGNPIPRENALSCIVQARTEIEREIYYHWTHVDIPIPENLVFIHGTAELNIYAAPFMYRTYCLMLMLGVIEWGRDYDGFIEVDMLFTQTVGARIKTLGTGSLRLSGLVS